LVRLFGEPGKADGPPDNVKKFESDSATNLDIGQGVLQPKVVQADSDVANLLRTEACVSHRCIDHRCIDHRCIDTVCCYDHSLTVCCALQLRMED
jgi:hypothetical protein